MEMKAGLPIVFFTSQREWEEWLEEEHDRASGVWVKLARKQSGIPSVTYAEAVESALCYGWIDGQAASLDDKHHLQRFSSRTKRSRWSRINRERATDLIERGRMKPPGLAQIEAARADGRWDAAYEPPSTAEVPEDLQRALEEDDGARAFFEKLDRRNRYAILHRIADAKRPETRARRIEKFVGMLAAGERLHD